MGITWEETRVDIGEYYYKALNPHLSAEHADLYFDKGWRYFIAKQDVSDSIPLAWRFVCISEEDARKIAEYCNAN